MSSKIIVAAVLAEIPFDKEAMQECACDNTVSFHLTIDGKTPTRFIA